MDLDIARTSFKNISQKLTFLLEIHPELFCQASLQYLCDALRRNPSLNMCHLAVQFDLKKAIEETDVLK